MPGTMEWHLLAQSSFRLTKTCSRNSDAMSKARRGMITLLVNSACINPSTALQRSVRIPTIAVRAVDANIFVMTSSSWVVLARTTRPIQLISISTLS